MSSSFSRRQFLAGTVAAAGAALSACSVSPAAGPSEESRGSDATKQLLIRADDLGYSYAVNLGIARTINEGLVRSTALMPNMSTAEHGWELVRDADPAIGQHTNICLGTPCADPSLIPSLVDENGQFHLPDYYKSAAEEGTDPADYDELIIEIEAQLARFREITGKEPDYFEAHFVPSENLAQAIHDVSEKYGYKEQPTPKGFSSEIKMTVGDTVVNLVGPDMVEFADYDPFSAIREAYEALEDGDTTVMVFHPGYLDAFVWQWEGAFNTPTRTKSVDGLIDPEVREWLESKDDLRLVDYRDL